jgi:hypothetical protein
VLAHIPVLELHTEMSAELVVVVDTNLVVAVVEPVELVEPVVITKVELVEVREHLTLFLAVTSHKVADQSLATSWQVPAVVAVVVEIKVQVVRVAEELAFRVQMETQLESEPVALEETSPQVELDLPAQSICPIHYFVRATHLPDQQVVQKMLLPATSP